jgi:hypothetical protein
MIPISTSAAMRQSIRQPTGQSTRQYVRHLHQHMIQTAMLSMTGLNDKHGSWSQPEAALFLNSLEISHSRQ